MTITNDERELMRRLMMADEAGVKLEIVGGVPLWEFHPARRHQEAIDRIRASLKRLLPNRHDEPGCACIHLADVYVKFPDGSMKRPDISIFCREPDEEDEAITLLPMTVIEIVSAGYEAKDLDFGVPFYLSQLVKDVIIFDPYSKSVIHARRGRKATHVSPVTIDLECGCQCTV